MDPFARSQQQVGGFEVTARQFSQKSEEVDSPALSSLSNQSSGSVVDWAPSHILKQKRRPAKAATYHGIPTQSRRPSNLKARLQKCTTANVKRLDRLTKSAGSEFTSGDESSEQAALSDLHCNESIDTLDQENYAPSCTSRLKMCSSPMAFSPDEKHAGTPVAQISACALSPEPYQAAEAKDAAIPIPRVAVPSRAELMQRRCGFSDYVIKLAGSYFIRLLNCDPAMYAVATVDRTFSVFVFIGDAAAEVDTRDIPDSPLDFERAPRSAYRRPTAQSGEDAWLLAIYTTCVFVAAKIVDQIPCTLAAMLRELFTNTTEDVGARAWKLEADVCSALQWRLGPHYN